MSYEWIKMFGFRSKRAVSAFKSEKEPLLPLNSEVNEKSSLTMWRLLQIIGCLICLFGIASSLAVPTNSSCDRVKHGYHCKPRISHFWGQYSMFFSVPSEISLKPPKDCDVTFANVLSRHGGRDPTVGKHMSYALVIAQIQNSSTSFPGNYAFLKNYTFNLGIDQLTDSGRQEMINSGIHFFRRYRQLVQENTPFVRSGGQDRVVESGEKWLEGIGQSLGCDPKKVDVVIPECSTCNNTLSHDTCQAFKNGPDANIGENAQKVWVSQFVPPIQRRINGALGTNLSMNAIINFMEMCPFDTLTRSSVSISEFCRLFTEDEWHEYDYYQSLGKFYGYGVGNPLGATQGVGYVNELIARLTGKPVEDQTNTNRTLDSDPKTFPLDRKVYADFSHDNDISGVLAALGLYNQTKPLSTTQMEDTEQTNGYSAAWTVPFASRMYVEKLQCEQEEEEFVRIIINDRVMPLEFCNGDEYGRCKLSDFVESQSFARGGGLWDKCHAS